MTTSNTIDDDKNTQCGPLGQIGKRIVRAANILTSLMFATMFLIFCYKIIRRYIPPQTFVSWADELSVILFIWIVFIANGYLVDERRQIAFDLLHRHVSQRSKRYMEITRQLLIGGLFIISCYGVFDYILFLWREKTSALQWRLDIIYLCFGIFMIAIIVRYTVRTTEIIMNRKL